MIIYITGLSGSGKTTIAKELQNKILNSILLDGDEIRHSINSDIGFEKQDKIENIRRNNELIKLLHNQGFTIICAFMSSISSERNKLFNDITDILKIQLTTPLEVCQQRDPKGHYKKNLKNFAGVSSKYEPINNPDLKIDTSKYSLNESINVILERI